MKLLNIQTGAVDELSPDETAFSLAAGTHVPPENQGVLLNPTGELVFVPGNQVGEAVNKYGYSMPEPEQLKKYGETYKFNTPGMQLAAFGAGAARGASFGVSDWLATKTNAVNPETLRLLQEYNPYLSGFGEAAGIVGTSFIPISPVAGVMKGAKAVEDTARALIAGKAATTAAKAPVQSMAGKIADLAVESGIKGLGGAIEGAAYGLGKSLSEASLGDEDLTAEKVMANVGQAAFIGGAFSAALVPGRVALSKSVETAKKAYTGLKESLLGKFEPIVGDVAAAEVKAIEQTVPDATFDPMIKGPTEQFKPGLLARGAIKAKAALEGKTENEIVDSLQRTQGTQYITPKDLDIKATQLRTSLQKVYDEVTGLSGKVSKELRAIETENLLVGAPVDLSKKSFESMVTRGLEVIQEMSSKEFRYNKPIYKTIEDVLEGVLDESAGYKTAADYFRGLNEIKQRVFDDTFKGRRLKPDLDIDKKNTIVTFREFYKDIAKALEDPNVWGEAAARQQAYNRSVAELLSAIERDSDFAASFLTKGPKGKPIIKETKIKSFLRMINDDRSTRGRFGMAEFLNAAENYIPQAETTIKNVPSSQLDVSAVKQYIKASAKTANEAKDYVSTFDGGMGFVTDMMQQAASGNFGAAAASFLKGITEPSAAVDALSAVEKRAATVTKTINKAVKTIFEKMRPPARGAGILIEEEPTKRTEKYKKAIEKINKLTDNPAEFLDRLEKSTENSFQVAPKISQASQMAVVRAVNFLVEKKPKAIHQSPMDQEYEPSQAQMIKYLRYDEAVENPLVVLSQLERNNVLPETIETLQKVYPKLYADIQGSIMGEIADKMAAKSFNLPYQKRIVLSNFLGVNLDSTMMPDIINRNQMVLNKLASEKRDEDQARDQALKTSQAGLRNVSLAERSQTNTTQTMLRA